VDGAVSEPAAGSGSPHQILNPSALPRPSGYSHVVVAGPGRTIYLAGQTAHAPDGSIVDGIVEQFDAAAGNVVTALDSAGARPEHLVPMLIFTTDIAGYLAERASIGRVYQGHFGKHYVATALIEVKGLVRGAKIELVCVAVVPDEE